MAYMAKFKVKFVNAKEGIDSTIEVDQKDYVLDAAEEAGLDLPASCRGGGCSICTVKVLEGELDQSEQAYLTDQQLADGYALICVGYAKSDCTLETHHNESV